MATKKPAASKKAAAPKNAVKAAKPAVAAKAKPTTMAKAMVKAIKKVAAHAKPAAPVAAKAKPHRTGAKLVRTFSWRPDVPDHRDRFYTAKKLKAGLPAVVERLGFENVIEDQGNLGSCTGNSSTSMLEIKLGLTSGLSRLMAYYNGRVIDGTVGTDDGAQIRSVIKGLTKTGTSVEALWPYDVKKFATKPSAAAFNQAKSGLLAEIAKRKLGYYRVLTLDDLLNSLANGNTVTFGFSVPASFDNLPASALLALPKKNEAILGGHAVVAVGYDLKKKFVWVRNSWGANWGINGYFKMPFAWFNDPRRLVDDMWTIQ